jgi:hypothetical protein
MHTFLIGLNLDDSERIGLSARITASIMPSLGQQLAVRQVPWTDLRGGYFSIGSEPDDGQLTIASRETITAIVFGHIQGPARAADRVLGLWRSEEDCDTVRRLEGTFSAVVVDHAARTLWVMTDLIGAKTLRYSRVGAGFLLSPHDVPIVATGLCPLDYDVTSAASMLALDWSLDGQTLLEPVRRCDSRSILKWNGELRRIQRPLLSTADRLEPRDVQGRRACVDSIVDALRSRVRHAAIDEPDRLDADLTAGQDSRAALGVVLAEYPAARVRVRTSGGPEGREVRVARRIATAYGLEHVVSMPEEPTDSAFGGNCDFLAFFWNGDTSAKRALRSTVHDPRSPIRFRGGGGEIYRGYWYKLKGDRRSPYLREHALQDIGGYAFRRKFDWTDGDGVRARLLARLQKWGEECFEISQTGHDVLDFFYVFERFGRWALDGNTPAGPRNVPVFGSPSAVAHAFKLPSPIAAHCGLNETLVARFLPRTLWWPVNRYQFLPLSKVPLLKHLNKAAARWAPAQDPAEHNVETRRAELLRRQLSGPVAELLTHSGSMANLVLAPGAIEKVVRTHELQGNQLRTLGILITMEHWKAQVERARALAAENGGLR